LISIDIIQKISTWWQLKMTGPYHKWPILCAAAGFSGGCSALCGKFAGNPETSWFIALILYALMAFVSLCHESKIRVVDCHIYRNSNVSLLTAPSVHYVPQMNGAMLAFYSASLRHTTSLRATACSVAINIMFSGLLGRFIFGEALPLQWWLGLASLFLGILLVQPSQRT